MSKNNKSKLLLHTPYLDLYKSHSNFYYAQRKGVNSIAVLCFRKNSIKKQLTEFLVHFQIMPQIAEKKHEYDMYACPITGSFENNENPITCAIREVYEEGGILLSKKNLIASSKMVATTQMNEQIYHMIFDVTGLKQVEPLTDGSYFESLAENKWMNEKELEKIIFNENTIKLNSLSTCYFLWRKCYSKKY
ncbi:NUDIX domain-containing protein [Mycoplasmoides pirum]|uniref:NUDIX domain-containing protein n=1 Tax=Mycoplasmoides pirum TaxID=2122 RepID=UPI0004839542|nr:NUDIX hydrolase [Mycoplasmoides pirum]